MDKIINPDAVRQQYANDHNLMVRAHFHQRFNTNHADLRDWFFEHANVANAKRILEVGCGNGDLWQNHLDLLPLDATLTLSDFAVGILQQAQNRFANNKQVSVVQVDVQEIPFPDNSFDVVIANHVLHHIPNIPTAITEMHRVLRPGGTLYALANGTNGLEHFLHEAIKQVEPTSTAFAENLPFNLQNGAHLLANDFSDITAIEYPNSLHVTDPHAIVEYVASTKDMQSGITNELLAELDNYFAGMAKRNGGAIDIKKEIGLFTATA
jgi:ubiquinone/menaquinone biosynthesis C-methylase UbiE